MSDDKLKFEEAKLFYKLEKEFDELKENDQKARKHGKSPKLVELTKYIQKLRTLIVGEGCEFYEFGWCEILNDKCPILENKMNCETRKQELHRKGIQLEDIIALKKKRVRKEHKRKLYEFEDVEKTKRINNENNETI